MEDPRALLQRYNLAPRKSLGQNFLVATSAPSRIAEQANLTADDTVLEIGAGVGTLTSALAARAGRVVAVETDPELVSVLAQEFAGQEHVEIVHGDILELSAPELLDMTPGPDARPLWGTRRPHYKVVANLPYYITAAVIRHILEAPIRPAQLVVTVQHEVAKRITARPGDLSVLAVGVQFYGAPRICFRLGRGAFYPAPKVNSAVVRVDLHDEPPVSMPEGELDVARFFTIVRAGFAHRRKQLHNTLSASLHLDSHEVAAALDAAGIDSRRRAQTLTLEEWAIATQALAPLMR
jgi:16S rRNA (adenine1518-N6/adenine1519-N6)-dimethyltransferase